MGSFLHVAYTVPGRCSLQIESRSIIVNHNLQIFCELPEFNRNAGKIYIIGTLVAAVGAFRLALVFDCVGCRYSLIPLSLLLFFTTCLAWYAIRQRNITAHKQFMVRSYVCALAFVFVRLYQVLPLGFIFQPIKDDSVFAVVAEWTFSILPIILVEIFMIWIPSIQSKVKAV